MASAAAPTASQACPRVSLIRPTVKTLTEKPVYLLDGSREYSSDVHVLSHLHDQRSVPRPSPLFVQGALALVRRGQRRRRWARRRLARQPARQVVVRV
jgi:hypothetical protein